jgi:hypothetical protein
MGKFKVRRRTEEEKKAVSAENALASDPEATKAKDDDVENIDIIQTLLSGEQITQTLETPYGAFEFAYPGGKDTLNISYRKAQYLNGYPASAYDVTRLFLFEKWATLDVLIVTKPAQFAKMTSWADFPDQEVMEDLYERGSLFCKEIRQSIVEARPGHAMG